MAEIPLPGLVFMDHRNVLSEAASLRISDAHAVADLIRTRALAAIEARYRSEPSSDKCFFEYHTTGQAAVELAKAKLEAARTVLSVFRNEFQALGKSGREIRQIMQCELDDAVHSLGLTTIQRDVLWRELGLYQHGSEVQTGAAERWEISTEESPADLSQPQRRLCWWRDPENYAFDGFPKGKTADPEARYRYERAQAELQFRADFDGLNGVPRPRNELIITCNLENCISVFVHHALFAFGDFLLDKRTPGTEALQAFEQHANELLTETLNRKWLFGLRHFGLMEDESSEKQFWADQKGPVDNTRRAFEDLLWNAELEEAASPVDRDGAREGADEIRMAAQVGEAEPAERPESRALDAAVHNDTAPVQPITGSGGNRKNPESLFPKRASWLKDRLAERAWNRNDPLRQRGPDPKTIDKILSGEAVRADVLEKLANALSRKHAKVGLLDIPRD